MHNLLEKFVNCFGHYIDKLSYGIEVKDYHLLYKTALLIKSNINNPKYNQYYYNNLKCPIKIKLTMPESKDRMISFAISELPSMNNSFIWTEIDTPSLKTYDITNPSQPGYNFIYISIPTDLNFIIFDALSNVLFNSAIPGNYEFNFIGSITTSKGKINSVYRKKNMYNTHNPVTFQIKLQQYG